MEVRFAVGCESVHIDTVACYMRENEAERIQNGTEESDWRWRAGAFRWEGSRGLAESLGHGLLLQRKGDDGKVIFVIVFVAVDLGSLRTTSLV